MPSHGTSNKRRNNKKKGRASNHTTSMPAALPPPSHVLVTEDPSLSITTATTASLSPYVNPHHLKSESSTTTVAVGDSLENNGQGGGMTMVPSDLLTTLAASLQKLE